MFMFMDFTTETSGWMEMRWGAESVCTANLECTDCSYYDLVVDGEVIKDAVWYYKYPTAESAAVAGRLCFYNEKVDVFIDGVKEEK